MRASENKTHPGVVAVRNALLCPRPIRGIVDGTLDDFCSEDGSERGEPEYDMGVSCDPPTRARCEANGSSECRVLW